MGDLPVIALLDGNLANTVVDGPVDGAGGQSHIERHIIVMRRQRLQIGADLVADIPRCGGPVGTDNHHVDPAMLHQVPSGIVDDEMMRNTVAVHLPACELSALVARAGLVDPDMEGNTGPSSLIHG